MREMFLAKKGIALLITLFFIMAITVAIGIGLKQVNEASANVQKEKTLLQTSMILDDILNFFNTSKLLGGIKDQTSLYIFLSQASFIPFESSGIKAMIELSSARSKFPVNKIRNNNASKEALIYYLNQYMVNPPYVDMLLDATGGISASDTYLSGIFYDNPYLYRQNITSLEHLSVVNDFYMKTYRDNKLDKIELDNLFSFSNKANYRIDLNYATPQVWELLLGCDNPRAIELSENAGAYTGKMEYIQEDEKEVLAQFSNIVSYFEPYINVNIEIIQDKQSAKISFEYDMKLKKGYNFVYEI